MSHLLYFQIVFWKNQPNRLVIHSMRTMLKPTQAKSLRWRPNSYTTDKLRTRNQNQKTRLRTDQRKRPPCKLDTLPSSLAISKSGLKSKFSLNSFSKYNTDNDTDDHTTVTCKEVVRKPSGDANKDTNSVFSEVNAFEADVFDSGRKQLDSTTTESGNGPHVENYDNDGDTERIKPTASGGYIQRGGRRGRGRGRGRGATSSGRCYLIQLGTTSSGRCYLMQLGTTSSGRCYLIQLGTTSSGRCYLMQNSCGICYLIR